MISIEDKKIGELYRFIAEELDSLQERLSIYGLTEEELVFFEDCKDRYLKMKASSSSG